MKNLLEKLNIAEDLEAYELASKDCLEYFANASEEERSEIRDAMIAKGDKIILLSRKARQEAEKFISDYIGVKTISDFS